MNRKKSLGRRTERQYRLSRMETLERRDTMAAQIAYTPPPDIAALLANAGPSPIAAISNNIMKSLAPIGAYGHMVVPDLPGGTIAIGDMPKFHSNPDSPFKIYLDFDGSTTRSWEAFGEIQTGAFDLSYRYLPGDTWDLATFPGLQTFDPTTFSNLEQLSIRHAWALIAEDFAAFNVDVTTDAPPNEEDLIPGMSARVVFGGYDNDWYQGDAAGVALLNSFDGITISTGETLGGTCFVFLGDNALDSRTWYVYDNNPGPFLPEIFPQTALSIGAFLGSVASHETGHMLALEHQSLWAGGTKIQEYWSGVNGWAPIMGGAENPEATWWNGTAASGADTYQDDMAVIASRLGFRADDTGSTRSSALNIDSSQYTTRVGSTKKFVKVGSLEQNTDVDFYRFQTTGGSVQLNIDLNSFASSYGNYGWRGNSKMTVDIIDILGRVAQTFTINASAGGMSQTLNLASGTYLVAIHGRSTVLGNVGQVVTPTSSWMGTADIAPNRFNEAEYGKIGTYVLDVTYVATTTTPNTAVRTADNSQSATLNQYNFTGAWTYVPTQGQFGDLSRSNRRTANGPINTATYTFLDLEPGIYKIYASWVPNGQSSANAKYLAVDGSAQRALASGGVFNQKVASNSAAQAGFTELTGVNGIQVRGRTLFVRVSNELATDGNVVADAIRIVRVGNLPPSALAAIAAKAAAQPSAADAAMALLYAEATTTTKKR